MAATVLIVDDHDGFRSLARRMLDDDGFEVVGEAADGASGLALAVALRPQVILLDVQLPDLDGFAVAELLAQAGSGSQVVMISTRAAPDFGSRLRNSRARGFIPKLELTGAALAELLSCPR